MASRTKPSWTHWSPTAFDTSAIARSWFYPSDAGPMAGLDRLARPPASLRIGPTISSNFSRMGSQIAGRRLRFTAFTPNRERLLFYSSVSLEQQFVHGCIQLLIVSISGASTLLRDNPSSSSASLLSPFVGFTYRVFASHHLKSSQVPYPSQN